MDLVGDLRHWLTHSQAFRADASRDLCLPVLPAGHTGPSLAASGAGWHTCPDRVHTHTLARSITSDVPLRL
ncbi:hypothetical protein Ssi02_18900 [Sinosporangium siamense]|uniref:Uncharacterized protein n=1 Tax=Sinosporangium siamense TaxID=1367973 RepID=A0A919RGZ4_9ACTN|nr:hypothetical protein Ssi02_18900 [Sinosporangium siamense]